MIYFENLCIFWESENVEDWQVTTTLCNLKQVLFAFKMEATVCTVIK